MRSLSIIRTAILIVALCCAGAANVFAAKPVPLTAPSLSASATSSSSIALSWTDPNNSETGYEIERSLSATTNFVTVHTSAADARSWVDNGLSSGTRYYYRARALDNGNKTSGWSSTANAQTSGGSTVDTTPPTVSLSSSLTGTVTSNSTIVLTASANDNVGVARVEFYDNGVVRTTDTSSPYQSSLSLTSQSNGTHYYLAVAYDAAGNTGFSSWIIVNVSIGGSGGDTTLPNVAFIAPSNGATYTSNQTARAEVSASDNVAIARVEISLDNVLRCTETAAPYTCDWPITSANNGSHSWTARAIDTSNNYRLVSVNFSVSIGGGDTQQPSVSISSPASGTTFNGSGTVTVNASASDNVGVTRVEFLRNGALYSTDTSAPYSTNWSISSSTNGTWTWTARAFDAAGNSRTSSPATYTVSVGGGGGDTQQPSVSISSPTSGATYTANQTVTITASASDNVGVTRVEFLRNGSLYSSDTSAPYNASWSVSSSTNGTWTWTARAFDAAGNTRTSSAVTYSVNIGGGGDTQQPSVSISSPSSGATYTANQTVTITASASDNVGVTKVEFYDGGALKRTDTVSPYSHAWVVDASQNGAHSWTAKAFDAAGNTRTSGTVVLSVSIGGGSGGEAELVGFVPGAGTARDIAVDPAQNLAYVASDEFGLTIFDVSVPSDPVALGAPLDPFEGNEVAISGNRAVVSAGDGLRVIDVSNPSVPVVRGMIPNVSALGVAVSGSYAYARILVPGNPAHVDLITVNISNLSSPSVVNQRFIAAGDDVVAANGKLYLTTGSGLQVFSLSNPAAPSPQGSVSLSGGTRDLVVSGNYAYVINNTWLHTVDVSNANSPSIANSRSGGGIAIGLSGSRLYALSGDDLEIFSLGNPAVPSLQGIGVSHNAQGVAADGTIAMLGSPDALEGGVYLVQTSSPSSSSMLAMVPSSYGNSGVSSNGSLSVVSSPDTGLWVVGVSVPSLPEVISNLDMTALDVAQSGNYAYARMLVPGNPAHLDLVTVSLSNPSNPSIVNQRFIAAGDDVEVANGKLYVTTGAGLQIYSLSNAASPSPQGSVNLSGGARDLAVSGSYAYVINNTTFHVINVSNANSPSVVASLSGGGTTLAHSGSYAYVVSGNDFEVVSVGNPSAPSVVAVVESYNAKGVVVSGGRAYLTTLDNGLVVYDVSNPSSPQELAPIAVPGPINSAFVLGNTLYVGGQASPLSVLDVP